VLDAVTSVVLGHDTAVELAVATFLAGGHVLIEDVPGVGKTLLAKALARAVGGPFGRVQATADLLPSDITGVSVHDPNTQSWSFRPGPLFATVVLVDELNRATPRAQSALLEAMAERQVTVDGTTHALADPFFVIATQNPRVDHGTFPLVAGQRDRFATRLRLGIPTPAVERALLQGTGGIDHLDDIVVVASADVWRAEQAAARAVHVDDLVLDYVVAIAGAVRSHPFGDPELSPRASQTLLRVAQARALLDRRGYVLPDDVKAVAAAVLDHRLPPAPGVEEDRAATIVASVAAPPFTS
jgi:MoxR-like ATPase